MANYIATDTDLGAVADAIRTKGGTSAQLEFPQGFVDAIDAIETGGGGDYTAGDFGDSTKPVGRVVSNVAYLGKLNNTGGVPYFSCRSEMTSLYMPNYNNTTNVSAGPFRDNAKLEYAVMPKMTVVYNAAFYNCPQLKAVDWLGGAINGTSTQFASCPKLNVMVIRKTNGVCSLAQIKAFNDTPFASGKTGGTLYVPQALIESYQAATNWSTILGYANNQILPIEGSIYETQYVDGTPIPTT